MKRVNVFLDNGAKTYFDIKDDASKDSIAKMFNIDGFIMAGDGIMFRAKSVSYFIMND
jgi:hypothetical protein